MNLLDLYVNIVAKDEASDKIDGIVGNIGGKIRNGMGTAVKAGAAAVGALTAATATGVVALGKAALDSYADYEQLAGGIEKLYGNAGMTLEEYAASVGRSTEEVVGEYERNEAAQELMLHNAQEAYRTAGMSANEYMEKATSFSASLIQSLGGDTYEAAIMADKALRAVSDNANAFGTDVNAVSDAIRGLARENYTMLDNLSLGYQGTAEEMMRLVNDSGVLGYTLTDTAQLGEIGFAKMVEAIQAVQVQQKIAGTTLNEASSTISGSIGKMKAAWTNFQTALADPNADIGDFAERLIDSFNDVALNVIPVIQTIGEQVAKAIPELLDMLIPVLMDLLNRILESLIPMLPGLVQSIVDGLVQLIPMLIEGALQLFMAIVQALPQIIPALIDAAISAIDSVIDMLPTLLPLLLEAAIRLFMALVEAIPRIIPALIQALPTVIQAVTSTLLNNIPLLLQCAVELFMALVTAVPMVLGELIGAVGQLLQGVWDTITSFDLGEAAGQLIQGFINGIKNMAGAVINAVSGVFGGAIDFVKGLFGIASPSKVFEGFGEMLDAGMAKGILGSGDDITDAFDSVMGNLSGSAMDVSVNARGLPSMTASTMAGVVITGNTFNVRQESDIEDIANRLALLIDRRG